MDPVISQEELQKLLMDESYLYLNHAKKEIWCVLYLFMPASSAYRLRHNAFISKHLLNENEAAYMNQELQNIDNQLSDLFNNIPYNFIQLTCMKLNWQIVLLATANKNEVDYENFRNSVYNLESMLEYIDYPFHYVCSPLGENSSNIPHMYQNVSQQMNILLFQGVRVQQKEKIREHSSKGIFNAADKKYERDFFMDLISYDFDGAISCLDNLLAMAGTGVYKDLSVFKSQLSACLEIACYILCFNSGTEQILTTLLPEYNFQIGRAGQICSKQEFREATTNLIDKIRASSFISVNNPVLIVQHALAQIHTYYMDPQLSASEIADRLNITQTYLSRVFHDETNYTVSGYIRNVRIERAKQLLATSEEDIESVARHSGFYSVKTFFRVFSQIEGITPGKYRKSCHSE